MKKIFFLFFFMKIYFLFFQLETNFLFVLAEEVEVEEDIKIGV